MTTKAATLMSEVLRRVAICLVSFVLVASGASAQSNEGGDEPVPLSIEVTISRHRGDEVVSSLPYMLSVTASETTSQSSLRMGADVPVLSVIRTVGPDGEPLPDVRTGGPFQYRAVGTNLDCRVTRLGDRFQVQVNIEESSVYGEDETSVRDLKAAGVPVFRSFQSQNTLLLRDGQSMPYTAAADRVTGERVRVVVRLTVLD